jgi:hypothetical protein
LQNIAHQKKESTMTLFFCWVPLLIFLVAGLLDGVRGIAEARIRRLLRREGIETKAVVIGHWVMGSAYYVKYRYYHEGQCYKREEQVGSSRYQAWPWGTVIPVRYLPAYPHVVRIANEGNHYLCLSLVNLGCAAFMVTMMILLGLPWWL